MQATLTEHNGLPVLALAGRLDGLTAPEAERQIDDALADGAKRLVIDCAALEYASSAGLRVFLAAAKELQSTGGRCAFAALTEPVREVFSISGFLDMLEVHDSVEAATS